MAMSASARVISSMFLTVLDGCAAITRCGASEGYHQ